MTRNRWTGLAGVLFGMLLFAGAFVGGSTPDESAADAPARYARYWADSSHDSHARMAGMAMLYGVVLLVLFSAGLRDRLRSVDAGPLPSLVLALGTAAAALLGAGSQASVAVGASAADSSGVKPDGTLAIVFDHLGYGAMAAGLMCGAVMAVTVGVLTLRTGVLPKWTAWLGFLIGLTAIGGYFTAWTAFVLLPVWAVVMGVVLLVHSDASVTAAA